MMNISDKVTVETWAWDHRAIMTDQEKRAVNLFGTWVTKEEPPCDIQLSPDSGLRLFINPGVEVTEEKRHLLLAWLIRVTGQKFARFVRHEETVYPEVAWRMEGDKQFTDEHGKFTMFIVLEHPALGKCKFVERTKTVTVTVKELVCDE